MRSLRLFVVRHGETAWNAQRRFQGHTDVPLSEVGIVQARALRERLRDEPLTAVYASDLTRASGTASVLAEPHGLQVHLTPDLRETMLGDWEGLNDDEIRARGEGPLLDAYRCDPTAFRPPSSEPVDAVCRRICSVRDAIERAHPSGSVVVVGHGGSLRALFCDALRAPVRCMFGFSLENASLSLIEYTASRTTLRFVNVTCHLTGAASDPQR